MFHHECCLVECIIMWTAQAYLNGRIQTTVVNGVSSSTGDVTCGVPQGSILGPTLFICYINDLEKHLLYSKPSLFADDTALLVSGKTIEEIEHKLNIDLAIAERYFSANKLQLNVAKTKSMLFRSTQRFTHNHELLIYSGTRHIEQVDAYKYLGVFLDTHLTFKQHIEYVGNKVKQRVSLLWRMRNHTTENLAKQLFISLILPVVRYCDYIYMMDVLKHNPANLRLSRIAL